MRLKWKLENRSLSFRRIQVGNAITTQICGRFTYRKCSCSNLAGCLHNISFKHDNWIHDAPPVQREPINEMMAWWNSNADVEDERRGIRKRRGEKTQGALWQRNCIKQSETFHNFWTYELNENLNIRFKVFFSIPSSIFPHYLKGFSSIFSILCVCSTLSKKLIKIFKWNKLQKNQKNYGSILNQYEFNRLDD